MNEAAASECMLHNVIQGVIFLFSSQVPRRHVASLDSACFIFLLNISYNIHCFAQISILSLLHKSVNRSEAGGVREELKLISPPKNYIYIHCFAPQ